MKAFIKKPIIFAIIGVVVMGWALWFALRAEKPAQPAEVVQDARIPVPLFSHAAGFYDGAFFLTLSGEREDEIIRFTLDGSEPTPRSPAYITPIRIDTPEPTLRNSPMSAGSRPEPPPQLYYNGRVVRARIFNAENAGSPVVTQSYFVARDVAGEMRGQFDIRVVSIAVEPPHFASGAGMYTNYNQEIRHMAHTEVFAPDGELLLAQYARLHVAGKWSRRERQKALRLNFGAGNGTVQNMELIPDAEHGTFRHVTLRIADLHNTTLREALAMRIAEPMRPLVQHAAPAAVFVNGEYWGLYCLREHRSNTFVAANHPGTDESAVTVLEFAWNIRNSGDHSHCTSSECRQFQSNPGQLYPLNPCFEGVHAADGPFGPWLDENGVLPRAHPLFRVDLEDGPSERFAYRSWMRMYNAITGGRVYCDSCIAAVLMPPECGHCRYGLAMHKPEDFDAAMVYVCMDNLIDWFIAYYHFDNWDWPGNNIVAYLTDANDKWRFILHDFDNAFWEPHRDSMELFTTPGTVHGAGTSGAQLHEIPKVHDNQPRWAVEMWQRLLENALFRETLAARYATYLGTVLHPQRLISLIDELEAERENAIGANAFRWGYHGGDLTESVVHWRNAVEHLRWFARVRGGYGVPHMCQYFNRTDRPHLGLGLTGNMIHITWRVDTDRGYLNIAGAHLPPDIFARDGAVTVDPGHFSADYIWGMPFEAEAVALDGWRFSHFEIQAAIGEVIITDNPMRFDLSDIAPPPDKGEIVITAVFEAS